MKKVITKEQIIELYFNQNKTSHECQNILNISRKSWKRLVKKFGIQKTKTEIRQKREETNLKKYGATCSLNNPEIRQKAINTCMQNYGVAFYLSSETVRKRSESTLIKIYGTPNISQSSYWKRVMRQHFEAGIPQQKAYQTKKLNSTFGFSQPEKDISLLLIKKFGKNNVIKQYMSELYPFKCDFYIKSLDLYIEYQGTWQHGKKPYNPNDIDCIKKVNKWKTQLEKTSKHSYKSALERYLIKDPLKREIARKNNLNFKEFFTMKEFNEWFNTIK